MDKHRLTLIAIGIFGVAILFGGWLVGVQPQLDRIAAAQSQTADIAALNDAQQQRNDALAAENANLGQYQLDLAAKQQEIPATRAQQELINQIDAAAVAAGVTVDTLRFDVAADYVPPAGVSLDPPSSGTLIAVPLTLSANGERPQLESFIALLQQSPRVITITSSRYKIDDEKRMVDLAGVTWVLLPAS